MNVECDHRHKVVRRSRLTEQTTDHSPKSIITHMNNGRAEIILK